MRLWILAALLILPLSASAQSNSTDSQTLQALLSEMRQLRQELRAAHINSQRAQILIYRVQSQQTVVTRLTQRSDTERSRLTQIQSEQRRFNAALKRMENEPPTNKSDSERKQADFELAQVKSRLEQLSTDEQEAVTRKMQAEEELRLEQDKLTQLQAALDRIDKDLERAAAATASPQ
jgi:chromosome segregation ATPase